MIYIVSLQASFPVFSPKKKKNQRKRRNKITLVSPYTLSDMFSYYVYKIRKLCPFLHYWVINLSSLSGSPVKPSSKMNYGCRQQSGACMSLSFSQYVCADKQGCMCVYTCVCARYISPCKRKIKLHAQESEGQGSLLSFAVHISHPLESAPRGILCSSAAFFLESLTDVLHKLL